MVLDIIAISIIILLFIRGYRKGIIVAAFSLLGVLLGITCAMALSAKLSSYLFEKGWASTALAPIISYAILFIGVLWLSRMLAKLMEKATSTILLGGINKLIGGILYSFIGITVWSSVLWLFNHGHILAPETVVASKTYNYIQPIAPWVFDQIGKILPFAKNVFGDMRHFFNNVNQQLPEHVGSPR